MLVALKAACLTCLLPRSVKLPGQSLRDAHWSSVGQVPVIGISRERSTANPGHYTALVDYRIQASQQV